MKTNALLAAILIALAAQFVVSATPAVAPPKWECQILSKAGAWWELSQAKKQTTDTAVLIEFAAEVRHHVEDGWEIAGSYDLDGPNVVLLRRAK